MDFLEDCVLGSIVYNHDLTVIFIMPLLASVFLKIYFWISWFLDLYHKSFTLEIAPTPSV